MNLQEATDKYLGKSFVINWSKLPGFERKGATIPKNTSDAKITSIYEMYDGKIVFLSDKTFTPFDIKLRE